MCVSVFDASLEQWKYCLLAFLAELTICTDKQRTLQQNHVFVAFLRYSILSTLTSLESEPLNQIQMSFKNVWFLLDKHQASPMIGEEAVINYENFLKVGEKAGPKCK